MYIPHEVQRIIQVANSLISTGNSGASTGERIAAAFVLNDMSWLPEDYEDVIEAWDRLGPTWQEHVRLTKQHYLYELLPW